MSNQNEVVTAIPNGNAAPAQPSAEVLAQMSKDIQAAPKESEALPIPPKGAAPAKDNKILGKFDNVDALAKAYAELEAKLGQPKVDPPAQPEAKSADQAKPDTKVEINKPAEESKAGLDLSPFVQEFEKDGKLSDDSFAKLEKSGLPKHVVNAYIEGQVALREKAANEILNQFGGKDQFARMADWARTNWDAGKIAAFDAAVNGSDAAARGLAVEALKNAFKAAGGVTHNGRAPAAGNGSAQPFASMAEYMAAISGPNKSRYDNDPAYRNGVHARRFASAF